MHPLNTDDQTRVLLVDDDAELLFSAQECLNLHGEYNIQPVLCAEDAFEQLILKKYDVIVCDIQMPVTNGFELLKKIRAEGNTIPFIVFTVTEDKQTVLKSFSLGANGFVGKYGEPETVFSTLKRCIDEAVVASKKSEIKPMDVT